MCCEYFASLLSVLISRYSLGWMHLQILFSRGRDWEQFLFKCKFWLFVVLFGGSKVYLSTVPFCIFDILQSVCVYLCILGYTLGIDSNTRDFFHSFHDTCWWNIPITCPNPLVHATCFSPWILLPNKHVLKVNTK